MFNGDVRCCGSGDFFFYLLSIKAKKSPKGVYGGSDRREPSKYETVSSKTLDFGG